MGVSVVARKLLWGRAGNRCAWPECDQRLTIDAHDPETAVLVRHGLVVGEEAHIRSCQPGGPRHDPDFPAGELDSYENLLLLCPTHHAIIDKNDGVDWPTEKLLRLKAAHTATIDAKLGPAAIRGRDLEERVAAAVEHLDDVLFSQWQDISVGLNGAIPRISIDRFDRLIAIGAWLLAKDWPVESGSLPTVMERLRLVLSETLGHIAQCFESDGRSHLVIERAYKHIGRYDPVEYDQLFTRFSLDAATTWWLVIDLTREQNRVLRTIRLELDPTFRFESGVVLMEQGNIRGDRIYRLEHDVGVATLKEYPTVAEIKTFVAAEAARRQIRILELPLLDLVDEMEGSKGG